MSAIGAPNEFDYQQTPELPKVRGPEGLPPIEKLAAAINGDRVALKELQEHTQNNPPSTHPVSEDFYKMTELPRIEDISKRLDDAIAKARANKAAKEAKEASTEKEEKAPITKVATRAPSSCGGMIVAACAVGILAITAIASGMNTG